MIVDKMGPLVAYELERAEQLGCSVKKVDTAAIRSEIRKKVSHNKGYLPALKKLNLLYRYRLQYSRALKDVSTVERRVLPFGVSLNSQ